MDDGLRAWAADQGGIIRDRRKEGETTLDESGSKISPSGQAPPERKDEREEDGQIRSLGGKVDE